MAGKTIRYYNLTGGLNTIQGLGTINQTPNKTEATEMTNVEFYQYSGLTTMQGNTLFGNQLLNDSGLPDRVILGYEYIYGNERYLLIGTKSGKVYEYNPKTDVYDLIFNFYTSTTRMSMCGFNNGVIISNGVDDLVWYRKDYAKESAETYKDYTVSTTANSATITGSDDCLFETWLSKGDGVIINGHTYYVDEVVSDTEFTVDPDLPNSDPSSDDNIPTETLTDVAWSLADTAYCNAVYQAYNSTDGTSTTEKYPVRGLALNSYEGRIFVGSNDGVLYYSSLGLIHNWTLDTSGSATGGDAGAIPSFYEDNSDFVALGIWDKYLVLHKREKSYLLNGTDSDTSNWSIEPYSNYTCDSQQSFVNINNGYYVYSRVSQGIFPMLQRTIYNSVYQGKELSLKIHDSFKYLNTGLLDEIYATSHPYKQYIMFYMPLKTGLGSNDCFIYDYKVGGWLHRHVPQEVTAAFQYNNEVFIGTEDGTVLKEFNSTSFYNVNDPSNPYPVEFNWKSPWFTFGGGTNWTTLEEMRVKIAEENTSNFYINTYNDGGVKRSTRHVTNNQTNATGLIWDVGYNEADMTYKDQFPEKITSYELLGSDGNTYYATDLNVLTSVGGKLYLDKECTQFYCYSQTLIYVTAGTASDYTYKVDLIKPSYAYYKKGTTYKAYAATDDSGWIAWIKNDTYNVAYTNIKKTTTTSKEVTYYCFGVYDGRGYTRVQEYSSVGYSLLYIGERIWINKEDYDNYSTTTGRSLRARVQISDSEITDTVSGDHLMVLQASRILTGNKVTIKVYVNSNQVLKPVEIIQEENVTFKKGDFNFPYSTLIIGGDPGHTNPQVQDRYSSEDITEDVEKTSYVSNGSTTAPGNGLSFSITARDEDNDTITVNGKVLTRDSSYDSGSYVDTVYYNPDDTLSVGDKVYTKSNMTGSTKTISSVDDDDTYTCSDGTVIYRYEDGDTEYTATSYFKSTTVTYTQTGNTFEIDNPDYYPYPTDGLDSNITDTKWDLNKWVKSMQVTKRFPVGGVYFQTIQLEFKGETINNNMTIYGFELDGIQLTETPY